MSKYSATVPFFFYKISFSSANFKDVINSISCSLSFSSHLKYILRYVITRKMCPSGSDPHLKSNTIFDFRQAFNVLDTDKDGKISRDDLKSFYSIFSGTNLANDEDIGSMIYVADWNKNGFVEFDEFEKVLGYQKNAKAMNTSMEDVFKVMDRDGDGKIGFDDLKDYLKWAGVYANDDDVKAMIKLGGGDEKEGVGYQGLLKILAINLNQEF